MRHILPSRFHRLAMSIIFASLVLCLAVPLFAQTCNPPKQVRTGIVLHTPVFVARVVVRDKKGKDVRDLKGSDFVILADGKPENTLFLHSLEPTDSTCTGIIIDRSGSREHVFPNGEFAPIENYVVSNVDSNHGVFLVALNDQAIPVGGFLTNSAELNQELARARSIGPLGTTARNDAIELAARELANARGYRILVIVTEGDDNHSKSTSNEAIDAALRVGAAVYFIELSPDSSDRETPEGISEFTSFAERITEETGGEVLYVRKKYDFDTAFAVIKEDFANTYLIGFSPSELRKKTEFHKLKVRTKEKDLKVIAPSRFYWPNQSPALTRNREK